MSVVQWYGSLPGGSVLVLSKGEELGCCSKCCPETKGEDIYFEIVLLLVVSAGLSVQGRLRHTAVWSLSCNLVPSPSVASVLCQTCLQLLPPSL